MSKVQCPLRGPGRQSRRNAQSRFFHSFYADQGISLLGATLDLYP